MNDKGFEFSFGWLFAIIVGAAIIALAIYATTNYVHTQRQIEDSSKSVELSSLLKQLETGLESTGVQEISSPVETRVMNTCATTGVTIGERTFGVQQVSTSVSSSIGAQWSNDSIPLRSQNLYLFSNKTITGKSFVVMSQRFSYPYKVADLIIMWPQAEKHCFVNSPPNVQATLTELKVPNTNFTTSSASCPAGSVKFCFAQGSCDVSISSTTKSVTKQGKTVFFDDVNTALFYAAIFSDPTVYDCQAVRLGKKAAELSDLYLEEARFGMAYGCAADTLVPGLTSLGMALNITKNSQELTAQKSAMEDLRQANDALICPLF